MPKDILAEHSLAQTSPKQAARNVLSLKAAQIYGRDAIGVVFDLTREQNIDPSQPDFDQEAFLKEVGERLNQ